MRRFCICLFIITICQLAAMGQKIKTVSGSYTYYPPETQSFEEARQTALYRAKLQILADTFGTVMTMTSTTRVENSGAGSEVDMLSLGESSVKGEWMETVGDPEFKTEVTPQGMLAITVHVTGKVREITEVKVEFEAKVLKNGTEDRFEGADFNEGDEMFLSFRAPLDGYLAVYLYDGADDVYCLLPYQQQSVQAIRTERRKRYVFFSSRELVEGIPCEVVDEYILTCSKTMEINRIYVIWSPNEFYRVMDSFIQEGIPRALDFQAFRKWLSKIRIQDKEMAVKTMEITIRKNN